MDWLWLIPLNVALLLVPAMFGVWAWAEVIERIREDHMALGRRTQALRFALVAASATYLVGAGTWVHPAMIEYILATTLVQRMLLYTLIAIPWIGFGVIGLLARSGRRTGLRGFLEERTRQTRRMEETQTRSRAFLHAIGIELEAALDRFRRVAPSEGAWDGGVPQPPAGARKDGREPLDALRDLAKGLQTPMSPVTTVMGLDDAMAQALEQVRPLAEERRVSVFRSGLEGLAVLAGPGRLRQVMQVLFEGALERAPREDGVVVITVARDPAQAVVQVAVQDNGPTPTDTHIASAYALDRPSTTGTAGLPGIGFALALARRLARQDGGDIEIAPAGNGGTAVVLCVRSGVSGGPPDES